MPPYDSHEELHKEILFEAHYFVGALGWPCPITLADELGNADLDTLKQARKKAEAEITRHDDMAYDALEVGQIEAQIEVEKEKEVEARNEAFHPMQEMEGVMYDGF